MAERRMFAKTIIDSDAFLDMPMSARLLYYDLSMRADDDGFNNSPNKVARMIGATKDDLNLLILKKFIIPFENGVIVIKHWRIHNYIRKDTYNETKYKEQKALLELDENKAYRIASNVCQLPVDDPSTQVRLGKDRLDKDSIDNIIDSDESTPHKKPTKHKYGENKNVLLSDDELQKLKEKFSDYEKRIDNLSWYIASKGDKYRSHYKTILNWARKENEQEKEVKKTKFNNFEARKYDLNSLEKMLLDEKPSGKMDWIDEVMKDE